jgi:hypothetical protein
VLHQLNLRSSERAWTKEPLLSELLRDPIAKALMVADHVALRDLNVLFANVKCQLRRQGPPARTSPQLELGSQSPDPARTSQGVVASGA